MRVIVSESVLDGSGQEPWKLHELLLFAVHGKHILSFESSGGLDRCLGTFEASTREPYARAIALSTRAAANLPADVATVRVEAIEQPRWEDPVAVLPLEAAISVLREPLGVLLENSENDWSFLLGIMRPSERERTLRAVRDGWVNPLHGGGATLIAQLRARLGIPHKGLRTFVLFDSDRLHPDELDPAWTTERPGHRPAGCQAFEWERVARDEMPHRYWMLQRRFIESYMPVSELPDAVPNWVGRDTIEAFSRMSQGQRCYFNMKNGFEKDAGRDDSERARDLYAAVSDADRTLLWRGLGPKLADHYAQASSREFDWDEEARREASAALPRLTRLF